MPEKALKNVASKHHLTIEQVGQIIKLLDSGYSIPYIMRYHKELAAALEPDDFYELIDEKQRIEKLESRRQKILKKLRERDILTDALEEKITQARDMRELIDHYVPYRPRKRSQSRQALSQGLGSLAHTVLTQETFIPDMGAAAEPHVDPEKGLETVEQVIEGVFHIVSDWVAEEKTHRDRQRRVMREHGKVVARRARRSVPGRLAREFRSYFDYRENISKIHPYHMLCILRGKRLKAVEYEIEPPLDEMEKAAAELYLAGGASQLEQIEMGLADITLAEGGDQLKRLNSPEFLVACIRHSLRSILAGITAREFEKELQKKAEGFALETIQRHVKGMLMTRPTRQVALAIHPGYRTGCNLAVLDTSGAVLQTDTVYPHAPQSEMEKACQRIASLVQEHDVGVVAIGDGTASEETEDLIGGLIGEDFPQLKYAMISEVGLDTYATSHSAQRELPEMDKAERCAVSIGRRLLDPLAEVIKINPRDLCPEPYVDEVNGGRLKTLLERTIEECVCRVGVEVNSAHFGQLVHVSGLDADKAHALMKFREEHGKFVNRLQIRNVPGIDDATYERAIGFLKVADSANPLDFTRIHPRYYPLAQDICNQLDIPLEDLATEEGRTRLGEHRSEIKLAELEKDYDIHYLLLKDIIDELATPWPEPRDDSPGPLLRSRRLTIADLEPDQWVEGTVRNIVDFGAFVDIGVGEDGLVHISELSERFVETPYDVVAVGDKVRVRVLRIEEDKGRIALSMREETQAREPRERKPRRQRREEAPGRRAPHPRVEVPSATPKSIRSPHSTVGSQSRRVQKAKIASEKLSKTEEQILRSRPSDGEQEAGATETERPDEAQEEVGGLLDRLDFANIERRGEPR